MLSQLSPSDVVKWVGLYLDKTLSGRAHIAARTASPPEPLTPPSPLNKSVSRCIAGSFRTAGLAALEKEAALLPTQLRIGRDALNTVAYYLTLPPTHILRPLLRDAIAAPPKNPKCCSTLHLVERVPGIRWPPSVPARGQRIRTRGTPRLVGALEDPLVEFGSSLGIEPILPVYAAPLREPLPVTTSILPKVDVLRALSLALGDERRRAATWFTDGSLLDGRAGGPAVRVEEGEEKEKLVMPLGNEEVCDGEMEGYTPDAPRKIESPRKTKSSEKKLPQNNYNKLDKLLVENSARSPWLASLNLVNFGYLGLLESRTSQTSFLLDVEPD
ncbi:hypothetical protein B0H13DRAFT_1856048 [Mycena leptocephala]|nr:hypothetical protein B0H13DRAFT_1856048 [Mycena leptocephala]